MTSPAMVTENKSPSGLHVAMLTSAGMGHYIPFLRLARVLALHHGFTVTIILPDRTVSPAEASHVHTVASSTPNINVTTFQLLPSSTATKTDDDPFLTNWDLTLRSIQIALPPLLKELLHPPPPNPVPPLSAFITDQVLAPALPVAAELNLPAFVFFISSAFMLGFSAHAPKMDRRQFSAENNNLQIPGYPYSSAAKIPQPLRHVDHPFSKIFLSTGANLPKANGILVDTFHELEPRVLSALPSGQVAADMPPVYAVGPLFVKDCDSTLATESRWLQWLDAQPARSVVYLSFGSRSALPTDQIRELAAGLESSQQRFLWVLRTSVIPGESNSDSDVDALIEGFESRMSGRGVVVRSWVPEVKILSHVSTGAFVSHCGWNSVMESIWCCVPLFGDQPLNAKLVVEGAKVGLAVNKEEDGVVKREEVERVVKTLLVNGTWGWRIV